MTSVQFKAFPTQTARTLNSRNASTSTSAQLPAESAADKKAEEQQNSSKVTLSDLSKHLSQAMQMLKSPKNVSDASKSAARYQAALLKQQMDNLKKIAAMMGPIAAKSILRQIKQIAQQIGRIAAELGEPSPIAAGDANIGVASANASGDDQSGDKSVNSGATEDGVAAEEAMAQEEAPVTEDAEETAGDREAKQAEASAGAVVDQAGQAVAEAEKEVKDKENERNKGVSGTDDIASQRHARGVQGKRDVEMVRDLVKDLRQLLSWVKAALQRKDKEDKESLKEIDKQLKKTEKLMQSLEVSSNKDIDIGNINSAALSEVEASTAAVNAVVDTAIPADNVSVASISVYA